MEWSVGKRRILVDRGTSTYETGAERDALRGTASHNTVQVDGRDQFELWKSFRVGRRAAVRDLQFHSSGDRVYVTAWHDGYEPAAVVHRRTIVAVAGVGFLIHDLVLGRGQHTLQPRFRLHPDVRPQAAGGGVEVGEDARLWAPDLPAPVLVSGLYSRRLGDRTPTTVIEWELSGSLPQQWTFLLALPGRVLETGPGIPLPQEILRCAHGVLRLEAHSDRGIHARFE